MSFSTANANPTVSITSPSAGTTAKGKLAITSQFAADPSGTATISEIGISIANAPSGYTGTLTLGGYRANPGTLGSTNVDAAWTSNYWNGSSATFNVDTTAWPAGTYSITVTVLDSNNRSATSAPVSLVVPKSVQIELIQTSSKGSSQVFSLQMPGVTTLSGGSVTLLSSDTQVGPYAQVGNFTGPAPTLVISSQLPLGTWVRAQLSGSSTLNDAVSNSIQVLGVPTLKCSIPSSAKLNAKVTGKCVFDTPVSVLPVALNVNSGSGWHSIGSGSAQGASFPITVVGKILGALKVSVTSPGVAGKYGSFTSNTLTISIHK